MSQKEAEELLSDELYLNDRIERELAKIERELHAPKPTTDAPALWAKKRKLQADLNYNIDRIEKIERMITRHLDET